jgi:hypothetical protein
METLKEVSEEVAPFVGDSGTCPDEPVVREDINRARRLLYKLGDWRGTTQDILVQSYGGTVTLPPWFEHISKMWSATRNIVLPNEWWAVVTMGLEDCPCGCICKPVRMTEPVVAFRELKWTHGEECFFRAEIMFESYNEEDGTQMIIHGFDKESQKRSMTRTFIKANQGISDDPINDFYFRSLYQVTKPRTDGRVRLYGYIPDTSKRVLIGLYEANDINPKMTRYLVSSHHEHTEQYIVTAKKKYVPIVDDNHPVELPVEALIHTLQALTARRARNLPEFGQQLDAALAYLGKELGENDTQELGRVKTAAADVYGLTDPYYY